MINLDEIKYYEAKYYIPTYCGVTKVSISKINDDIAIVKPYSRKKDFRAFPIPLKFVCGSPKEAKMCGHAWEHWKRTQK